MAVASAGPAAGEVVDGEGVLVLAHHSYTGDRRELVMSLHSLQTERIRIWNHTVGGIQLLPALLLMTQLHHLTG